MLYIIPTGNNSTNKKPCTTTETGSTTAVAEGDFDAVTTESTFVLHISDDEEGYLAKHARQEARSAGWQDACPQHKILRPIDVGDNVAVPVSHVDRSKGDPPNLIGVVPSTEESGDYKIGTRSGIIKGKLARNQVEFVRFSGLKLDDVPQKQLSIREIVRAQSVCGGQGFRRCHCNSSSKRCSCVKGGLHCNSACHIYK